MIHKFLHSLKSTTKKQTNLDRNHKQLITENLIANLNHFKSIAVLCQSV